MKAVINFANAGCAANQQEAQEKRLKSTFALVCNQSDTDDLSSYVYGENVELQDSWVG